MLLQKCSQDFKNILEDESGQSMVEYGLLLSLITLTALGAVKLAGGSLKNLYGNSVPKVIDALGP